MNQIQLALSDLDLDRCFPVMVQLRPHLSREEFIDRVRRQQQAGYQLAYVEAANQIRAVAGFRCLENLYSGRLLYVDDLVTDANDRSQGYGKALLDWLISYAREQGCASFELDSGVHRSLAHRFYFREGMTIASFHFQRSL